MSDLPQLAREDLAGMSASSIIEAGKAGQLENLMSTKPAGVADEDIPEQLDGIPQINHSTLKTMTASEIMAARHDGRLRALLGQK